MHTSRSVSRISGRQSIHIHIACINQRMYYVCKLFGSLYLETSSVLVQKVSGINKILQKKLQWGAEKKNERRVSQDWPGPLISIAVI